MDKPFNFTPSNAQFQPEPVEPGPEPNDIEVSAPEAVSTAIPAAVPSIEIIFQPSSQMLLTKKTVFETVFLFCSDYA
jgi:hypothetical protein